MQIRKALAALVVASVTLAGAPPAAASSPAAAAGGHEVVPGELLVRFEPGVTGHDRAALRARHGLEKAADLPVPGLEVVRIAGGLDPHARAAVLSHQPGVRYAEPNYVFRPTASVFPNDPRFIELWGLHNIGQTGGLPDADIDATEAWGRAGDTSGVVVAVVDSGIDISHPDLAANAWTNPGEVAGNGLDDDGNGYADDVHGWDFYNRDASVYDAGQGDIHGTHVAGTLAAVAGNGIGMAGVSQAQIMPLKFMGPDGGSTADAVRAIDYAIRKEADVINGSWGGSGYSHALADAISRADAAGQLFVVAAGNGADDGVGDDLDASPVYPASYPHPNVIAVAATTSRDRRSSFSNYGATTVDIGAPGSGILSTTPNSGYAYFSGTSMASPLVAGAVAHLIARHPTMSHADIRARLFATADPVASLAGITTTGGRLNLDTALDETVATDPASTSDPTPTPSPSEAETTTDVEAGSSASTDPAGATASASNPTVLTVTSPVAGAIELVERASATAIAGHRMVPASIDVTAPVASTADPLVFDLQVAIAALPSGAPITALTVFRNGAAVPTCTDPSSGEASPDPCVARSSASSGAVSLRILTSRGSTWSFGVPAVTRIAGPDRLATAIATAQAGFGDRSASAAVLARSDDFADALAGANLAVRTGGPLLLTPSDRLASTVAAELSRVLSPGATVHVLGGPTALAPTVADAVRALGNPVQRHAGGNRFTTAVAIAEATTGTPGAVLLTTGRDFPDALAASSAAATLGGVVLLTDGPRLPAATREYLEGHPDVSRYAVGGPAASAAPSATALVGANRYATAIAVAERFFPDAPVVGIATGRSFPDALGAGARMGRLGAPLLLVGTELPRIVEPALADAERTELFGGAAVVSAEIVRDISALLG